MAPQTYSSHAHRPTLTGVGYLFVVVAIVSFVMRWLLIGGRVTMAIGLIGLIGGEIALLMISRTTLPSCRIGSSDSRCGCERRRC